ncbi:MAG: hypothetical protein RMK94_15810 [Armatimonadota bacterium]|nr:hypothetical protein [Armatimonadota bacterium]
MTCKIGIGMFYELDGFKLQVMTELLSPNFIGKSGAEVQVSWVSG